MTKQSFTISALHRCNHPVALWPYCSDDTIGEQARMASRQLCRDCEDSYKTAWVGAGSRPAMKIIEAEWAAATGPLTPARRQELLSEFPIVRPPLGQPQYRIL